MNTCPLNIHRECSSERSNARNYNADSTNRIRRNTMKHSRSFIFLRQAAAIAIFSALLAVPVSIAYQQAPATQSKAEFPSTPEGKLARALFDSINSGDKGAMEKFIKENLSSRVLNEDSVGDFVTQFGRISAQSG